MKKQPKTGFSASKRPVSTKPIIFRRSSKENTFLGYPFACFRLYGTMDAHALLLLSFWQQAFVR
ncbi:hypothetical protein ABEV40_10075 [Geobacillus thermocatenulatus]|uniref:hypothetical protein n=2 Tax=Anoxybacillaceae TaxID=3120669 RepID=UPI000FFEB2F0